MSAKGDRWFEGLLPIRALTFEMRFTQPSTPGFFHQAALTAWLRYMLASPEDYDLYITIDNHEQGRTHFKAGDDYRFSVIASCSQGESWLLDIIKVLQGNDGMPQTDWHKPMPFRDNWQLERILSWPQGEDLGPDARSAIIDANVLSQQASYLRKQSHIGIRMTSPWRILRAKQDAVKHKGEMRFCRDNVHLLPDNLPLWLIRTGDAMRDLARRRGIDVPPRGETSPLAATSDLFWIDASYKDVEGNHKPMGGLMGMIESIDPALLSDEQLLLLVLGQYLGVGQRRAFGYGRYQLLDEAGHAVLPRTLSLSLLNRAMSEDNLIAAAGHVLKETTDVEDEDNSDDIPADPDNSISDKVREMADKLLRGSYSPPALNGFVHEDADGGLRPLAAPPIYDRILQRAVHQQLAPVLDTIMHHGSYGFRAGRSRYQVRDLIQRLYREGYRYVFESDIRSFFDTVTWPKLAVRLQSLLGDDPAVEPILTWMRQPVRWKNQLIKRDRGLPQGSPLSPVLANMMLDDFDHDLRDAGCSLIRFADDFVIVAKSREVAEEGGKLAARALLDAGLELNEEKTRIVSFSEGFRFLGFTFVDGTAVESVPARCEDAGKAPPQSWLASAISVDQSQAGEMLLRGESVVPLAPYREDNRLLIFCGEPAILFTRAGSLCIERENECLHRIPWTHLDSVMMFGRHHMTMPALHIAMKHHVPIHMASASGAYIGVASSGKAGAGLSESWLAQKHHFDDKMWAMAAARSVVDARIRHMAESLRRRHAIDVSLWKPQMDRALRHVADAQSREELNGIEGNATKVYFGALKAVIPEVFKFEGRNRRPPMDPFNALLSFGYTLLYTHVDSLLRADGLLPVSGFYHRSHGAHSALASDLMEPFRHVVEREALNMLQGKRLKEEDFTIDERGCRMSAPARRLYAGALSGAFLKHVKARGGSEPFTILEHIHRQNLALKFALTGKSSSFQVWRMR